MSLKLAQNLLKLFWKKIYMKNKKVTKLTEILTFGDHPLQANDVLVGELAHDGGLAQKVLPLLLRVTRLQRLDGHCHLFPSRHLEIATVHLTELPCRKTTINGTIDLGRPYEVVVRLIRLLGFLVQIRKSLRLFCLRLTEACPGWVLRESLCRIIGGWPVVWTHGNQLSHEEKGGGGVSQSWELGGVQVEKSSKGKGGHT